MTTMEDLKRAALIRHVKAQGGIAAEDLTVRDSFAIAALPSMVEILSSEGNYTHEGAAGSAYLLADAMMKARKS